MATPFFILKRGSTLSLAGTVSLPAGTWTATSEVKDAAGDLISTLNVTLTPPTAPNTLWVILMAQSSEETLTWPLGPLNCDVRYEDGAGNVLYTPTFTLNIALEVTDE